MRFVPYGLAAMACALWPQLAWACPACQGVVHAEVLSQFWGNIGIAASPFVVFGIIATIAYRIR